MTYQEIGRRVRAQRIALGMSQEALAEAADISSVYVSQIECAVKCPSLSVLMRLVDPLHMSLEQLLREAERADEDSLNGLLNACTPQERHVILAAAVAIKKAMQCPEQGKQNP